MRANGDVGSHNDVYLAAVTGALRRVTIERGERLPSRFNVVIPVNMRTPSQAREMGNLFSHLRLTLPLRVEDTAQRILAVSRATRNWRASSYATTLNAATPVLGGMPPLAARLAVTWLSSSRYARLALYIGTAPGR